MRGLSLHQLLELLEEDEEHDQPSQIYIIPPDEKGAETEQDSDDSDQENANLNKISRGILDQPCEVRYDEQEVTFPASSNSALVAPISGQSLGLQRAKVTHGVREVTLCKDKDGKVGLRVKAINKGIFICVVIDKSPAALAGLRFGDQILQINDTNMAGFSMDKVHEMFKKSGVNGIKVVVRDRPFERTITLHKDSVGSIGFQFKNGKIVSLVKDSSAARNGVLLTINC
ncbi:hypothetical protein NQ318_017268 [Aromia moschata]|uniref:PDZ domain-containing protein n=1 Tax=Aromia moschata TaxID=1265417 RepID=A0AAV8X7N8_9CUCU|nr:hypothetical protein NQ318_017268 [Aromia moschata]